MPIAASILLFIALKPGLKTLAADISVSEDKFGVPSIVAANLEDASFALGYVQAKDQAERMATNYKLARGRLAEVTGRSSLLQDGFIRGLGLENKATEVASHLSGEAKLLVDGFLAGANQSLSEQKDRLPKWIEPFTAVDVLAFTQFMNAAFPLLDLSSRLSPGAGSNQFALAPSKTSTRHAIVSIDPHLGWDGQDGGIVWQEFAIYTPEIHFRGVAVPGIPIGVLGHNDKVAWSMTNNNPMLFTMYTVKTNPENRNQYSYHGRWKEFRTEKTTMRYLENGEFKSSVVTNRLTDWGPMVPFSNRSVRLAVPDPEVTLNQGLHMLRANSCAEFREALKLHGLSMWNFVYADVKGNIAYQYNAAVPKRDESFDWNKTVPGDDPKSEWGDLWSLDDLPHIENPASGILVNCNSSPTLTSLDDEIKGSWPADVTSYGPTSRWEILSALLKQARRVSPDQAKAFATDCTVPYAAETVRQLARFVDGGDAIGVLTKWDRKSKVNSVGCALYTYWLRRQTENLPLSVAAGKGTEWTSAEGASAKSSLLAAAQQMLKEQGALTIPWGDIQYMQRGSMKLSVQGFGYVVKGELAAVSPASAGVNTLKNGRSRATFGSSFRMIVSLDPKGIQSWSVLPYGNSNVASSPHYSDQMGLYAVGRYKATDFGKSHIKKYSVKTYHLRH